MISWYSPKSQTFSFLSILIINIFNKDIINKLDIFLICLTYIKFIFLKIFLAYLITLLLTFFLISASFHFNWNNLGFHFTLKLIFITKIIITKYEDDYSFYLSVYLIFNLPSLLSIVLKYLFLVPSH